MPTRDEKDQLALLQGTLDLLILRTLLFGPQHGQGIARSIQLTSQDELLVEHGASGTHYFFDHPTKDIDPVQYSKRLLDYFGSRGILILTSVPTLSDSIAVAKGLRQFCEY